MSDSFWTSLFGFAGLAIMQYLYHIRAMAAQSVNTRITVAAATGKSDVPEHSTQLEEVVKSVAAEKKETKDVAVAVAAKVEAAAQTVKKALNGELEETISKVVAKYLEPLIESHKHITQLFEAHQKDDSNNHEEVCNSIVDLRNLMVGKKKKLD